MNEHDEVRELLELAAVEPGGLDRLEAGDTPSSTMVVGHLVGCPGCLEEMARLRRAEALLRPILASEPDPALRERTLAFVRAVGVARDAGSAPDAARGAPAVAPGEGPVPIGAGGTSRRSVGIPAWAGTLAAALVIGVVGGALLVGGGADREGGAATALNTVASETATLLAAEDALEVVLEDAAGTPAGVLVVSPSAQRLIVTAVGLVQPAMGTEYRCWVEIGGQRFTIGKMGWDASVAWWSGKVEIPPVVPPDLLYGVSLVDSSSDVPGTVVLTGGP